MQAASARSARSAARDGRIEDGSNPGRAPTRGENAKGAKDAKGAKIFAFLLGGLGASAAGFRLFFEHDHERGGGLSPEADRGLRGEWRGRPLFLAGDDVAAAHDVIVGNIVGELRSALRDMPCEVYPAGLKVRVEPHKSQAADVTVVCQAPRFQDDGEDVLINPTIVFEVVSEATEAADRGAKFEGYAAIPTVAEFLLVATTHARVERFVRHADGSWNYRAFGQGEVVPLSTAGCQLKVDEVYFEGVPEVERAVTMGLRPKPRRELLRDS